MRLGKGPFFRMEFNIQTSPKCFFNKEYTYPRGDMMKEKNEQKKEELRSFLFHYICTYIYVL